MKRTQPASSSEKEQTTLSLNFDDFVLNALKSNGYLILNKILIQKIGLVPTALLANYMDKHIYFAEKFPENHGWFFLRYKDIQQQLNLSDHIIRTNKKILVDLGVIECKKLGTPAKEWSKLNFTKLCLCIGLDLKNFKVLTLKISSSINKGELKKGELKYIKKAVDTLPSKWKEDEAFHDALIQYIHHRYEKDKNGLTDTAIKGFMNKLLKHPIEISTQALLRSCQCGWTGVFPESEKEGRKLPSGNRSGGNYDDYGQNAQKLKL